MEGFLEEVSYKSGHKASIHSRLTVITVLI